MPMNRVMRKLIDEEKEKKHETRVHIYRDFITDLTPVFHGIKKHAFIYERT